ncbi:hypothetical protein DRJ17_06575, partial [Candidatus Woesearchaeota archaeon]
HKTSIKMIVDRRFKWLTNKQREIAKIAMEKTFVRLGEIKMFYSSKEHWTRALTKLIDFGILIPDRESASAGIFTKYL